MTRPHSDLDAAVARATSDYLAVSRESHLYAPEAYDRREESAWERLQSTIRAREAAVSDEERGLACTASR